MDAVDHIRLDKKRKELRETVAFKYIAAYLLRDGVLNSEEFQLISHKVTMQAQMDVLLEMLVRKGRSAFLSFISALEEDYSWLANDLKTVSVTAQDVADFLKNTSNVISNDQNDNHIKSSNQSEKKEITLDMVNVLQQNGRLVRRWFVLAYRLGLDRQAQSIKVRVNMNCEDLDQCLAYLIQDWRAVKPKDANLSNLIRALQAEQFNDVAAQLEDQF